ncbi:MAG: hypothetical protein OXC05_00620 [Halieaceae bacterium]|nr:hypothetical protein [Halieaceae bacterium]
MPTDRPHDGRDISPVLFGTGARPDSDFYANYIDPWSGDVIQTRRGLPVGISAIRCAATPSGTAPA